MQRETRISFSNLGINVQVGRLLAAVGLLVNAGPDGAPGHIAATAGLLKGQPQGSEGRRVGHHVAVSTFAKTRQLSSRQSAVRGVAERHMARSAARWQRKHPRGSGTPSSVRRALGLFARAQMERPFARTLTASALVRRLVALLPPSPAAPHLRPWLPRQRVQLTEPSRTSRTGLQSVAMSKPIQQWIERMRAAHERADREETARVRAMTLDERVTALQAVSITAQRLLEAMPPETRARAQAHRDPLPESSIRALRRLRDAARAHEEH